MKRLTLKQMTRAVLAEGLDEDLSYENPRNSDVSLMLQIWTVFYAKYLHISESGEIGLAVNVENLYRLPREDNIKRYRAIIQNQEKKFLPTNPEVRRKRRTLEEDWYESLGYAKRNPAQTSMIGAAV